MIPTISDLSITSFDSTEHREHPSEGFRATQAGKSSHNHRNWVTASSCNAKPDRADRPVSHRNGRTSSSRHNETTTASRKSAAPIAATIINELTHGQTPRMVADRLGLPLDFVNLVIERERRAGRLNIYDLRSCNSTTGEGCDPDPDSLICAGCPILPAAIRRRQSLFGRLKAKLRTGI
ncbi:hypothetical protein [Bifidobacterium sp. ESL0732]|uniref:hypothetical protein n=1 Tax=Bifidobacterium sp. ESL0732 TaxID=2983222 RepID=UPI0023F7AC99|nr:hypothetical protein [Bifidobacterium sp. ESL0732]WEV64050.1 hypothetical protein OZX70_00110 [Bifidobacterium sp. ESL0732]